MRHSMTKKPGFKFYRLLFFFKSNLMLQFRKLSLANVLTAHQHEKEQRHLMKFRIFLFETKIKHLLTLVNFK